jgi:D-alanyl-D-alanine carboxypeptidase/D-alanyl-D-alanine-endopeptidase (penicillin-binding protein 4)
MNRKLSFCLASFLSAWFITFAQAQQARPAATLEELQQRLTDHVSQPQFAAGSFGVKIVSLESGKTVFEHEAGKLFSPASNSKLYTVALALDQLGGDYRIKTSLYAASRPDRRGTLKGDLLVYGRGDPTINPRLHDGDIFKALQPLVAALTNAGVKRINGDLVGDGSFYRGNPFGSGWDCDDLQYYYGAEVSALTINDNILQVAIKPGEREGAPCHLSLGPAAAHLILSNRTQTVAVGARRGISLHRPLGENVLYVSGQLPLEDQGFARDTTVHNPAGLFTTLFKDALARNGIKLNGKLRTVNWLDRQVQPLEFEKLIELGSIESPPMRDIAREIQKPSQNLYTDLILAHMGSLALETNKSSNATSEAAGIRQLNAFLAKAGIRRGEVQFEEGSGLSRNNLTTPNATVALLQYMSRHAEAEAFLASLPVAGVDGTLRNRMKNTPAASNVRAKTGTLRWANSLSGYVTTAAGERLVFSIMLNRYVAGTNPPGRGEIDKIAVMLAEFNGRTK